MHQEHVLESPRWNDWICPKMGLLPDLPPSEGSKISVILDTSEGGRSVEDWSATRSIGALWRNGSVYGESYAKIAELIRREARTLFKLD